MSCSALWLSFNRLCFGAAFKSSFSPRLIPSRTCPHQRPVRVLSILSFYFLWLYLGHWPENCGTCDYLRRFSAAVVLEINSYRLCMLRLAWEGGLLHVSSLVHSSVWLNGGRSEYHPHPSRCFMRHAKPTFHSASASSTTLSSIRILLLI
jgi:hypothetical protein